MRPGLVLSELTSDVINEEHSWAIQHHDSDERGIEQTLPKAKESKLDILIKDFYLLEIQTEA